jgi:hypothetical protein
LRVARCGLVAGAFCCAGDDGQTPATIAMAIGIDAHDFQDPACRNPQLLGGRFSGQVGALARLVIRHLWAVRGKASR